MFLMAAGSGKLSGIYKNSNGEMSIEDMIKLKHKGEDEVNKFLKGFRVTEHPCPNNKLRPRNVKCFHCIANCWIPALDEIKEYKNYYKVKNKKYMKEELNENKQC